ncbi:MAG: hypothetical protein QME63_05095 [Actinomycetota bacterium]|nr:hypothetical protein [Actinomycetota bacterium]
MCQSGINTADFKLAIYQLIEHSKLLKSSMEQWAMLADSVHEHGLVENLREAESKVAEATALLGKAMDAVHKHSHVQIS